MTADQPQRPESRDHVPDFAVYMWAASIHLSGEGDECDGNDAVDWCQSCLDDAIDDLSPDSTGYTARRIRSGNAVGPRLAADPRPPVPNPDPALAYAPDGSVVGRVIGWATKPDGRSVPILGPAPEPEPPAQEAGG